MMSVQNAGVQKIMKIKRSDKETQFRLMPTYINRRCLRCGKELSVNELSLGICYNCD